MYNLNVNVAPGAGLLAVEGSCTTPKTPEILNSLIAMTNPFDSYPTPTRAAAAAAAARANGGGAGGGGCGGAISPNAGLSDSSNSCSSVGSSAGTPPLGSPTGSVGGSGASGGVGGGIGSPPSVQHTCSQLIKEGLKLTIQTKRRQTGQGPLDPNDIDGVRAAKHARKDDFGVCGPQCLSLPGPCSHLTAEDEERRRRRRERNKIAATKCRLKKRERTVNLVHESEILETQNHDLKSQIQDLETQRRRLMDMLSMHSPTCLKNNPNAAAAAVTAISVTPGPSAAGASPTQLSPMTPQAPPTPYCTTASDITTVAPHHHQAANYCDPYHAYAPGACTFNYPASGGVDGCMA